MPRQRVMAMSLAARVEERKRYIAPLFAYLLAHGISFTWLGRELTRLRGEEFTRTRMSMIHVGRCQLPHYFVDDCCDVLGKSVAEVMGPRWQARPRSAERSTDRAAS